MVFVPYTFAMSKFWRIAFAWLLALALPIQGYAAQTLLLCGPAHHQTAVAGDQRSHDDATQGHQDGAKPSKAGHAGKCSVCSSCCNAAAMASAVITIVVIPQVTPVVATIPAADDRLLLGGLDRPPRRALV